jgi:hypothetical protein
MTTTHLNGHHRVTLTGIFTHPAPHNIEWHDVLSLLNHVGTATARHGGGYDVEIGAEHVTLTRPHGHDVVDDELRDLRKFLTRAGLSPGGVPAEHEADRPDGWIVVVDHHQARVFAPGGDHAAPLVIRPNDDDGSRRRVEHRQGNDDHDGGHASEDEDYYRRIAAGLAAPLRVVVFSNGKGRSSAGEYLVDYAKRHDPGLAGRIIVDEQVDISKLTDGEAVAAGLALLGAH